jgi:hypothetical protein
MEKRLTLKQLMDEFCSKNFQKKFPDHIDPSISDWSRAQWESFVVILMLMNILQPDIQHTRPIVISWMDLCTIKPNPIYSLVHGSAVRALNSAV